MLQPNSARAWLAPITQPIARWVVQIASAGRLRTRKHLPHRRRVVQVTEDGLQSFQALQEGVDAL